ncbi:hypothetical protein [Streptacidiphilus sp. EB103A]|uniref:hypothetical protein n=1 Tax=Streptacidiphilus sp. EB103A TaxID=3156275 RepID=UPI003512C84B
MVRIDARVTGGTGPGSVLIVHLSRHDPGPEPEPDDTLFTRFLTAVEPDGPYSSVYARGSQTSAAVAAWVGEDEPPDLVVDRLMSTLFVATAAGALIDDRTCRVGLKSMAGTLDSRDGMLLTMTSETAGAPVELFPALLYCWRSWWLRQVDALRDGPRMPAPPLRGNPDTYAAEVAAYIEQAMDFRRRHPPVPVRVPRPPERLDLIENGRRSIVRLGDVEPTTWPDAPSQDRGGLLDEGLDGLDM